MADMVLTKEEVAELWMRMDCTAGMLKEMQKLGIEAGRELIRFNTVVRKVRRQAFADLKK